MMEDYTARTGLMENSFLTGLLQSENRVISTQIVLSMISTEVPNNIHRLAQNCCHLFDNHPSIATFSSAPEMLLTLHLIVYCVIPKIDIQAYHNRILTFQI
jgi:hypothetical protein